MIYFELFRNLVNKYSIIPTNVPHAKIDSSQQTISTIISEICTLKSKARKHIYNSTQSYPFPSFRDIKWYLIPRRDYATDMAKVPETHGFITEDELQVYFAGGDEISDEKARIYDFFQQPHTPKEKTALLKKELGTSTSGGNALSNNIRSQERHSTKGIRFEKPGCAAVELSWTRIVKYIDDLMTLGRFYTPEQLAKKQELEAAKETPLPVSAPVQDTSIWAYNDIKHDHPDDIVLYQMGDFFEIYGEDAILAAEKLDLNLTTRSIPGGGRVKMCGIPAHQLEQYLERLSQDYLITGAAIQDGTNARKVYSIAPNRPETVQAEVVDAKPAKPTIWEQYPM